jgi:luciferase family oxidoreductase group 1
MSPAINVPLSVLDLAWREDGQTNGDALRASVAMVQTAERLGYRRYWFQAHHGLPVSTASQPPILMAAAAAVTTTIRVGSGPLLLPNYVPLAVAEQFGTLRALYGDRIDLGIGRSSGGFPPHALRGGHPDAREYPRDVRDLLGFFHGDLSAQNPMSQVLAVPGLGDAPETWLLGSASTVSAQLAGELGLPFAYAHHFAGHQTEQVLEVYRRAFRPSRRLDNPHSMISVILVAADSPGVVRAESLTSDITHLHLLRGERPGPVPRHDARARNFNPDEVEHLARHHARQAIGTPEQIETQLSSLLASTGTDEIIFQLVGATAAGRQRSLEIVQGLTGPSTSNPPMAVNDGRRNPSGEPTT